VTLEGGLEHAADRVVLAMGGLLGGGIAYTPSEAVHGSELPTAPRHPFRASVEAPVTVGARGLELPVPGSLYGIGAEELAWPIARDPLMDRVGVVSDGPRASNNVYVAGDLMADRPRTWLAAMASGVRAAEAAVQG
jgi:glycerol-3-phosphate dehydrogenase subunit B